MDIRSLVEQNSWWKDAMLIEQDYDIQRWKQHAHLWIPDIVKKITLKPFALHIISGPRQAGKTTALKLLIKTLLEQGKNPKSLFYFNCENVADSKELEDVLRTYKEFQELNGVKESIIILDEITLPKEWFRTIKFLIDTGTLKYDVVILTGSSSITIKRQVELFPGRRGNGNDYTLHPLSFRAFLRVLQPELEKRIPLIDNPLIVGNKVAELLPYEKELTRHLLTYFDYGGFPLAVASIDKDKEEAKRTYLSWIKNAILKADRSDIIARQIIKVLVESTPTDISWEGIARKIEVKSPKTVASYIDLLTSLFVINVLYNIDISTKKLRFAKNKKIHFRDPLLLEILEDWCLVPATNKTATLAESVLVEHLSRAFPGNVHFWKDSYEIDAIVLEKNNIHGFEMKWSEHAEAKIPHNLTTCTILTKKEYSKKPSKIPLSLFLSMLDV